MSTIGYVPFEEVTRSRKAQWLRHFLGVELCVVNVPPPWNSSPARPLPPIERLVQDLRPLLSLPAVILEGPGAFVWAALLRAEGFAGAVTVLPGVNPRGWRDVLATAVYRRYADRRDRVFVGSRPSAAVFSALGVASDVGEPYGVDDRLFRLRPEAGGVRSELGLPSGRMLLYAGQAQRDHDLHSVLQVGLKARLLFPDLCVVVASPGVDDTSVAALRKNLGDAAAVHFAVDPSPRQVADLYNVAEVALTASTTGLETFGRAPAEALVCGCPSVAPRYDGFGEVLAQPGGTVVEPKIDQGDGTPRPDEVGLLRAVYDVLTAPRRPAREDIADVARRRFGRSQTMGLLRNVLDGSTRRPDPTVIAAGLAVPRAWEQPLARLATGTPGDALVWCWSEAEHDRLAEHDAEFELQVRRSLCVQPQPRSLVRSR